VSFGLPSLAEPRSFPKKAERVCHSERSEESLQLISSGTAGVLLPRLRDQNDRPRRFALPTRRMG